MKFLSLVLCLALVLFFSCATETPVVEEEPQPEVETIPDVPEEPVEEPVLETVEEPEAPPEEEFTVTEEVFERTFQDIESLIIDLNNIIKSMDYDSWLSFLSDRYIEYYSDEETLAELSSQPLLQKYNIRLTGLRDYFEYVVAPSRANARLDDLLFEDQSHVKAIMLINGQRTILYQLVLVDDRWKIGI